MADNLNHLLNEANEADRNKDYSTAVAIYDKILETVSPEFRGKLQLYKGVSYYNLANYDLAIKAFDLAISSGDQEVLTQAWANKARAYQQQNLFEEASVAYEELAELDSNNEFMKWAEFAHCYNQMKQHAKALEVAAKGLVQSPGEFDRLHNERIFAFFKLNRPLDSLPDIEGVLKKKSFGELRPEEIELYSEVLTQKGHELMQKEEYTLALHYLQQVYDATASPNSMFLLGVCLLRMRKDNDAEKWLVMALEKCPTDSEHKSLRWKIHVALGTLYMRPEKQNFEEATDNFQTALSISPEAENANVHFNNGFALMKLKRDAEAKKSLEFVYNHDSTNWIAAALLGTILVTEPNYEKAIEVLERAIEISNGAADDSVYYNLAYAYMMLNRYKDALKYFEKAYQVNPANKAAKTAMDRMREEVEAEEERARKAEEERIRREKEEERLRKEAEEAKKRAEQEKNEKIRKEKMKQAEEARKRLEEEKAEAERARKIKIQEAKERRLKRLAELQVLFGGPQQYRARRPSLDLIPDGNTNKNAHKYADWYNDAIVKKTNGA